MAREKAKEKTSYALSLNERQKQAISLRMQQIEAAKFDARRLVAAAEKSLVDYVGGVGDERDINPKFSAISFDAEAGALVFSLPKEDGPTTLSAE